MIILLILKRRFNCTINDIENITLDIKVKEKQEEIDKLTTELQTNFKNNNLFFKPNRIEIPFSPPKAPKNKNYKYVDYIDEQTSYIKIPILPLLNKNSIYVSYYMDDDNIKDVKINQSLNDSEEYIKDKKIIS